MRLLDELTNQEYRVLALVAKGQRNAKIADELCISTRTVENHLYRIFDKLAVSSRTEAALFALRSGLLANAELSGISHDMVERAG
jgi:DNA-binding NarL/FixJ family response regulator